MPRRKKKGDDVNTNGWMDTYADTITLLLTFFILLYSISAVDSEKLKQLNQALQSSLKGTTEVSEVENLDELEVKTKNPNSGNTEYEDLAKKLNDTIEKNGLTEVIKLRKEDRGIVLQLDETILFDPGKADLKENNKEVLETITTIINEHDNDVLIEGHTDNVPMNNKEFASNWELSAARALSAVTYFVHEKQIDPIRFSVKGYGEYKPLVPNDTPENRAINRRVDILMVEQKVKDDKDTKASQK
ncbi:OmpA/MotB family protein [Romboutsia lituseburensis]|uniref:OmpA/MotB family protein n=1 Tax=Romboutsia lituseburensis TaxID=1537 RepID=UPI00215AC0E5|nr:OmpA family protein [Romboutsia lituseburensis]MCR8746728.1 OmpA family protein [Romboutsia lituseburensis]